MDESRKHYMVSGHGRFFAKSCVKKTLEYKIFQPGVLVGAEREETKLTSSLAKKLEV